MDINSSEDYVEQLSQGLQEAESCIKYIQAKSCSRLYPAVIPRFIPTCSTEMLDGMGSLVATMQGGGEEVVVRVHSHISESQEEVATSAKMHPNSTLGDAGVSE